jgi:hypothetical protein
MRHPRFALVGTLATLLLGAAAPVALADDDQGECYDAIVTGKILHQGYTELPDCGPQCFVMRWPWFWDLDVRRIIEGEVSKGRLTVQTVQHTWMIASELKGERLLLRRNDQGGFNLLWTEEANKRCAKDRAPARAFFRPGPGKRIQDYEDEASKRSGY